MAERSVWDWVFHPFQSTEDWFSEKKAELSAALNPAPPAAAAASAKPATDSSAPPDASTQDTPAPGATPSTPAAPAQESGGIGDWFKKTFPTISGFFGGGDSKPGEEGKTDAWGNILGGLGKMGGGLGKAALVIGAIALVGGLLTGTIGMGSLMLIIGGIAVALMVGNAIFGHHDDPHAVSSQGGQSPSLGQGRGQTIGQTGPSAAAHVSIFARIGNGFQDYISDPISNGWDRLTGRPQHPTRRVLAMADELNLPAIEREHHLQAGLLSAVMQQESGGNPHSVSNAGAQGLFQLMPDTARRYGVTNAFDTRQSAEGAARYLEDLSKEFHGDTRQMLAAYNWGEANVEKLNAGETYMKNGTLHHYELPKETKNYVASITAMLPAHARAAMEIAARHPDSLASSADAYKNTGSADHNSAVDEAIRKAQASGARATTASLVTGGADAHSTDPQPPVRTAVAEQKQPGSPSLATS